MNPNRREVLALSNALLAGGLLAGCTGSAPEGQDDAGATTTTDSSGTPEAGDSPAQATVESVVAGNTDFAFDLLDHLAESSPDENLFVSPYSASVALAMTYAGARGETRRQMQETLRFPANGEIHPAFRRLGDDISEYDAPETTTVRTTEEADGETEEGGEGNEGGHESSEKVPFRISDANALWGQTGYPFREAFLEILERNYGAGLRELDFAAEPESARRTINEWVADRTVEKITDLLPPDVVTEMTRLVLTNAIYFRANWSEQFEEEDTEDAAFTSLSGEERTVPMMSQTERFRYADVDGHQLVELPYAGGDASMVVVLPAEGAFGEFQRSLSADRLAELLDAMLLQNGTISLPRFTYRSKMNLVEVLSEMGMPTAFTSAADFTGMARGDEGERLSLGAVVHESFVSVDEAGTEAAAATAVVVEETAAAEEEFEMTVDRPFLFLIRDDSTGSILFLGRVTDAGAAQPDG